MCICAFPLRFPFLFSGSPPPLTGLIRPMLPLILSHKSIRMRPPGTGMQLLIMFRFTVFLMAEFGRMFQCPKILVNTVITGRTQGGKRVFYTSLRNTPIAGYLHANDYDKFEACFHFWQSNTRFSAYYFHKMRVYPSTATSFYTRFPVHLNTQQPHRSLESNQKTNL